MNEQFFLYEVLYPHVYGGRVRRKVPFQRMNEQIKQISSQGGKIVSITPLKLQRYDPQFNLAWWIEIYTNLPRVIYFFGPFANSDEAECEQKGYREDLELEGTLITSCAIKYCQPLSLTIELD